MSRSYQRRANSVARQATQLALAVPQVVTHRLTRLAAAGHAPSARDRKEFTRMVVEKPAAFGQAWVAMAMQAASVQQQLALSMWRAAWMPWAATTPAAGRLTTQLQSAALGVLDKGLAPVRRAAVANASRLGRKRR